MSGAESQLGGVLNSLFYYIHALLRYIFIEHLLYGRPHTGEWAGYKSKDGVHAPQKLPL